MFAVAGDDVRHGVNHVAVVGEIQPQRVFEGEGLLAGGDGAGVRREARVVAAQLRVDVARKRDFLLGGDGGDGLRSVADGGIAVVRGENRVLLVGFNQRGALQNALNQQGDALLGDGLCARRADAAVHLTAQGQAEALADLIILQLAAADAHPE